MSGTIWTTDWHTWEIKLDHKTAQGLLTPSLDLAVHLETIYYLSFTSEHNPLSEEELCPSFAYADVQWEQDHL